MKKAILFKKLKDKTIRCLACSHYCSIKENNVGICSVRKNIKGSLYLMVYNKPCSIAIDHIEKKPLFHFLPGTSILSLGTIGCNFKCGFCQNWSMSQQRNDYGNNNITPKQIIGMAVKNNAPSIAFTYNEPTIFMEYAYDIARLAKKNSIKTVFVTNGYESKESLLLISKYLDAMNIDLKSFNEEFYMNLCRAKLKPVLETIKLAHKLGIWIEITTLIIPGKNDSLKELKNIADFISSISSSIPWHVTAFHPDYRLLDCHATTPETLLKALKIGKAAGLKYVYTGNILLNEYETTVCPNCNKDIIKRKFMQTISNKLNSGKCPDCKTKIEGIWN